MICNNCSRWISGTDAVPHICAATSQSESEKFFAHLNNGEVSFWINGMETRVDVVITPKEGDGK